MPTSQCVVLCVVARFFNSRGLGFLLSALRRPSPAVLPAANEQQEILRCAAAGARGVYSQTFLPCSGCKMVAVRDKKGGGGSP